MARARSAESERRKDAVTSRDGGLCVRCGVGSVDIAHIVARSAGDPTDVDWIRRLSPLFQGFQKDDPLNYVAANASFDIVCPTHHRQFNGGYFVIVPTEDQRRRLREHEVEDFTKRKQCLERGDPDPGRSFPNFPCEFEFVPISPQLFVFMYHPTSHGPFFFGFDTLGNVPCHTLHFQASSIALMLEAQPLLARIIRVRIPKADLAARDVMELMELYIRRPSGQPIFVPTGTIHLVHSLVQNIDAYPRAPQSQTRRLH